MKCLFPCLAKNKIKACLVVLNCIELHCLFACFVFQKKKKITLIPALLTCHCFDSMRMNLFLTTCRCYEMTQTFDSGVDLQEEQ